MSQEIISDIYEYTVLYTYDITQKIKKWKDGKLKYYKFNNKVQVFTEGNIVVAEKFIKNGSILEEEHWGKDIKLGSMLVTVESMDSESTRNIAPLFKKNTSTTNETAAAMPLTKRTSVAHNVIRKPLTKMSPLPTLRQRKVGLSRLGTPSKRKSSHNFTSTTSSSTLTTGTDLNKTTRKTPQRPTNEHATTHTISASRAENRTPNTSLPETPKAGTTTLRHVKRIGRNNHHHKITPISIKVPEGSNRKLSTLNGAQADNRTGNTTSQHGSTKERGSSSSSACCCLSELDAHKAEVSDRTTVDFKLGEIKTDMQNENLMEKPSEIFSKCSDDVVDDDDNSLLQRCFGDEEKDQHDYHSGNKELPRIIISRGNSSGSSQQSSNNDDPIEDEEFISWGTQSKTNQLLEDLKTGVLRRLDVLKEESDHVEKREPKKRSIITKRPRVKRNQRESIPIGNSTTIITRSPLKPVNHDLKFIKLQERYMQTPEAKRARHCLITPGTERTSVSKKDVGDVIKNENDSDFDEIQESCPINEIHDNGKVTQTETYNYGENAMYRISKLGFN